MAQLGSGGYQDDEIQLASPDVLQISGVDRPVGVAFGLIMGVDGGDIRIVGHHAHIRGQQPGILPAQLVDQLTQLACRRVRFSVVLDDVGSPAVVTAEESQSEH